MRHHYIGFLLAGLVTVGCQAPPPAEPIQTLPKYQQQFVDAEEVLSLGGSIGVFYLHPMRKRACNTMHVRLSVKNYNGIEYKWEVAQILDLREENTAPVERRNLGTHPILFDMDAGSTYRIDAIGCVAYDKTVTTQYRNFAEFTAPPGEVAYLGNFTQKRIAEGVDLYIPADKFENAKETLELDSPELQSKLSQTDVAYFTFENFDGKTVTSQQLIDNVGSSGDYFTLSQTLKTQADQALLPFLGYLPDFDVPPLTRLNVGKQKEELQQTMLAAFDLTMLRLDMKAEFEAIIQRKQSYKTARNHINHRLAVANTERQLQGIINSFSERSKILASRNSIAVNDSDAFTKANGIAKITDPLVTKEQRAARKNWKSQIERTAYVLTQKFSGSKDTLKRDRVQGVMDDYAPAKYASLEIELIKIAERQKNPVTDIRRLRRVLKSAQENEEIILSELISNFMQENLAENNAYHAARASFDKNWIEIFEIIDFAQ